MDPTGASDRDGVDAPEGRIVLAGTPIGDPADAPARLAGLLATADVVAAEDTRRLRRLASALGVTISGRVLSHHEHNEATSAPQLVAMAASGATVLVVTDAGMPSVSDPGYRVVAAAVEAGVLVTAVPGPSAVLTALAVSGLATDRFCFEGFVPRRAGERVRALAALADERRTMVFFEAPHRLGDLLGAMVEAFGASRRAAVCREMTKTYEQVVRGGLDDLVIWVGTANVRGEVTLVVAGADPAPVDPQELVRQVDDLVATGVRLKDATRQVAARSGASAREIYAAVVSQR